MKKKKKNVFVVAAQKKQKAETGDELPGRSPAESHATNTKSIVATAQASEQAKASDEVLV